MVRAGPAKMMFKGQIGHAPSNFTNLDFIFLHGVVHALIDTLAACPSFFFLKRYDRSKKQKNTKSIKASQRKNKKNKEGRRPVSLHVRMGGSNTG